MKSPRRFLPLLLALALPGALRAEDAKPAGDTPPKNVISSYRVLARPGHGKELEAALAAHAKKFHQGDHRWRVGVVMSGPDEAMYHITEGPTNWTGVDGRGDLGEEHTKDYEANVAPHVEKTSPNTYSTYEPGLSTVAATQWTNKVLIEHLAVKPGRGIEVREALKKWKAIYEKLGLTMVTWRVSFSGDEGYSLVFRLKDGFKMFDDKAPKFREACAELYGPSEFDRLRRSDADTLDRDWSELIEFKPELSSP